MMDLAWTECDAAAPPATEGERRLIAKLNHRVKNLLSIVTAIAYLSLRHSRSIEEFEPAFAGRLEALSQCHDLVASAGMDDVPLARLARLLCNDLGRGGLDFSGDDVILSSKQLLGLGLILHELHTNALRHGALSRRSGHVEMGWRRLAGDVVIGWSESGMYLGGEPRHRGFGLQMIALTVKADLGGTLELDWRSEGLSATIRFPLAA